MDNDPTPDAAATEPAPDASFEAAFDAAFGASIEDATAEEGAPRVPGDASIEAAGAPDDAGDEDGDTPPATEAAEQPAEADPAAELTRERELRQRAEELADRLKREKHEGEWKAAYDHAVGWYEDQEADLFDKLAPLLDTAAANYDPIGLLRQQLPQLLEQLSGLYRHRHAYFEHFHEADKRRLYSALGRAELPNHVRKEVAKHGLSDADARFLEEKVHPDNVPAVAEYLAQQRAGETKRRETRTRQDAAAALTKQTATPGRGRTSTPKPKDMDEYLTAIFG